MAEDVVIRAEDLGKKYIVGHQTERRGHATLRDVLVRTYRNAWRKTLDMAQGRAVVSGDTTEEFWALKGANFEIKRGEIVGIVGRNGAGKTTLLKILSRITEPTEGRVRIVGRVASLLEVGTGFHNELTGRENIYLNGSILGMRRSEIRRKFDEIVAFAEVEKFLDTPVKRYSSGMYVRLAFAVAAHLEPEILVVDEVLAVGDAEFQKKCLGKMDDVAGHGRTVLFVSHNIGALTAICKRGILIESGRISHSGEMQEVAERYRSVNQGTALKLDRRSFSGPLKDVDFENVWINGSVATGLNVVNSREVLQVKISGSATATIPNFAFSLAVFSDGTRLFTLHDDPKTLAEGRVDVNFTIPAQLLRPGVFSVSLGGKRMGGDWTWAMDVFSIEVLPHWDDDYRQENTGLINLNARPVRSR